jgi:bifunctional non-homologous end joining protein LigD
MRRGSSGGGTEAPDPAAAPEPGGLPSWVEPQLATLTRDRFSDDAWIFERKLDGERCLAFRGRSQGVHLLTRNQHDVTGTFPEIAGALNAQRADGFIVDGEIVAFEGGQTRFESLQQRLGVAHPEPELVAGFPVYYYVFDVLYADGHDTRPRPELDRKRLLAETLSFNGPLRYTEHRVGDGEAFYRSACEQGWEGLIAKRADAPYRAGRSRNWLKFKCLAGQEFVIGGYTDPRGSREDLGALLLGYYETDGRLTYAGKVGTGFDRAMLRRLRASLEPLERDTPAFERGSPPRAGVHWVQPRLVGQVEFAEWTDDGLLRQPRFEGLRDDKDPRDVVREIPQ